MRTDRRPEIYFALGLAQLEWGPALAARPRWLIASFDVPATLESGYARCAHNALRQHVRQAKTNDQKGTAEHAHELAQEQTQGDPERQVARQAPVVDVLHVQVHPLLEGDLVAAGDLPDAGEARAHGQPARSGCSAGSSAPP